MCKQAKVCFISHNSLCLCVCDSLLRNREKREKNIYEKLIYLIEHIDTVEKNRRITLNKKKDEEEQEHKDVKREKFFVWKFIARNYSPFEKRLSISNPRDVLPFSVEIFRPGIQPKFDLLWLMLLNNFNVKADGTNNVQHFRLCRRFQLTSRRIGKLLV